MTGILEPHFPDEKRKPRLLSGIAIVITMVRTLLLSLEIQGIMMGKEEWEGIVFREAGSQDWRRNGRVKGKRSLLLAM